MTRALHMHCTTHTVPGDHTVCTPSPCQHPCKLYTRPGARLQRAMANLGREVLPSKGTLHTDTALAPAEVEDTGHKVAGDG